MLILKGLIGALCQVAVLAFLLLGPAPTREWPRAIQFLTAYAIAAGIKVVALGLFAPASLRARLEPVVAKSQPWVDRVVTAAALVGLVVWFALIPIDVFDWQVFPRPGLAMSVAGAIGALCGFALCFAAMLQNAFVIPIVRNQSDRGHVLVDTGLYGIIRHPFYLGMIVMFGGIGVWLESYLSLLTLLIIALLLVCRMHVEEGVLERDLEGYSDYMSRVKHRLVPYVW